MILSSARLMTGNGRKHINKGLSEPVIAPSILVGFQEKE